MITNLAYDRIFYFILFYCCKSIWVQPVLGGGYQKWEPIIEGSQAVMKYTYIHGCPQKNRIHITGSSKHINHGSKTYGSPL